MVVVVAHREHERKANLVITGAQSLVVTDNVIELQECQAYRGHNCAVINLHHICPESWWKAAGKPVKSPMIALCPTCHYNVHAAIDGLIQGRDIRLISPRCRSLARSAIILAESNGLTPALTL